MGNIPLITGQRSVELGGIGPQADPKSFGLDIGTAKEKLGQSIQQFGASFLDIQSGRERVTVRKQQQEARILDIKDRAQEKANAEIERQQRKTEAQQEADRKAQETIDISNKESGFSFEPDFNAMVAAGLKDGGDALTAGREAFIQKVDDTVEKSGFTGLKAERLRAQLLQHMPDYMKRLSDEQAKNADELKTQDKANNIANFSFEAQFQEIVNNAPPDGSGVIAKVREQYTKAVDEAVKGSGLAGKDANELRTQLMGGLPAYTSEAAKQQYKLGSDNAAVQAESGLENQINRIRNGGKAVYDDAVRKGLDVLGSYPNRDPKARREGAKHFLDRAGQAYVESALDKAAIDPEHAPEIIADVQREMNYSEVQARKAGVPYWNGQMSDEAFKAMKDQLSTAQEKALGRQVSSNTAILTDLKSRTTGNDPSAYPTDGELKASRKHLVANHATPEQLKDQAEIEAKVQYSRSLKGSNDKAAVDAKIKNGSDVRSHGGPGRGAAGGAADGGPAVIRSVKGSRGRIDYTAPNGVRIVSAIGDRTHVQGLQPKMFQIMDAMADAAGRNGVVKLILVAGAGEGHKSHGAGTESDWVGYQANGQVWTAAQRAAVARGGGKGGANRFGLYEGGSHRNLLHIGYSHGGFQAAVWGAGGLTGGAASRQFSDPASAQFAHDFGGGGVATLGGGRGGGGAPGHAGSYLGDLMHFESHSQNVWNKKATTSSGRAGGYFQITTGTWNDFKGAAGVTAAYPASASYEDQYKVASLIPMGRWAPETLQYLKDKGWNVDPNKTLAENVAANGGIPEGDGAPASDAPGDGLDGPGYTQQQASDAYFADQKTRLGFDPIQYAQDQGVYQSPVLNTMSTQEEYVARGVTMMNVNEYYKMKSEDNKFFRPEEASMNQRILEGNDMGAKAALIDKISATSEPAQTAIWKQLSGGKTPSVEVYAAQQYKDHPDTSTLIFNGQSRIKAAKDAGDEKGPLTTMGLTPQDITQMNTDFANKIGNSLSNVDPKLAAIFQQAATAYYVAKYGYDTKYNSDHWKDAVAQAAGMQFAPVNDVVTALPEGVPPESAQKIMNVMDPTLAAEMSPQKTTPKTYNDRTGKYEDVPAEQLAHAHLYLDGHDDKTNTDMYRVVLSDNRPAMTGNTTSSGPEIFLIGLNPVDVTNRVTLIDKHEKEVGNARVTGQGGMLIPQPSADASKDVTWNDIAHFAQGMVEFYGAPVMALGGKVMDAAGRMGAFSRSTPEEMKAAREVLKQTGAQSPFGVIGAPRSLAVPPVPTPTPNAPPYPPFPAEPNPQQLGLPGAALLRAAPGGLEKNLDGLVSAFAQALKDAGWSKADIDRESAAYRAELNKAPK